ncbi:MAG: sensor histidine kinase [Lachnospiraceae bacterium]
MLKKLHRQFTIFCAVTTSLILLGLSAAYLIVSEQQMKETNYLSFLGNANASIQYLEKQTVLSHSWLLETEASYNFFFRLYDANSTFLYTSLTADDQHTALFALAARTAQESYALDINDLATDSILSESAAFTLTDKKHRGYNVCVAKIPGENGTLALIILNPLDRLHGQLLRQRLTYAGISIFFILLLTIFAWLFTRRMLRPIRESRIQQAQFIASASHELRSPLTVILSNISALDYATKAESDTFRQVIRSEGTRMSHLIDNLLSLAHADSQNWFYTPKSIEIDTLFLRLYESYECVAAEKKLTLSVILPEEQLPKCYCDEERIRQLLSILLDNAISYTPAGGSITMTLENTRKKLYLLISDTGPGIRDTDKPHIFERFYRAEASRHTKEHFGLGLSIADEIIRLHKGKIEVYDTKGGGATFRVTLHL